MGTIKRGFANNILTTGKFDATDLSGTIPSSNVANTTLSSITSVPASVGDLVQSVAADPSPVSAGDVWYNSTTGVLKAGVFLADAWAAGGNLNTARVYLGSAIGGTQTVALAFGGQTTARTAATEEYNGSTWTNNPTGLNTARAFISGAGTQTAGLAFGGTTDPGAAQTSTEKYDGSTWTTSGNLSLARKSAGNAGTQTAGLCVSGQSPATPIYTTTSEHFNGTSWTAGGNVGTARYIMGSAGTQTAGLIWGGYGGSTYLTSTEEYNGSSWTAGGTFPTALGNMSGAGTQTAALSFGGYVSGITIKYDGTSWAVSPASLATSRYGLAGAGTQTAGLAFGGATPSNTAATEEFTGGALTVKTITTS